MKTLRKIKTRKKKNVKDQATATNVLTMMMSSVFSEPKIKKVTDFNAYSNVWKMYTYGPKIRYITNVKPPKHGTIITKKVRMVETAYLQVRYRDWLLTLLSVTKIQFICLFILKTKRNLMSISNNDTLSMLNAIEYHMPLST
jgi:hypothetical protein